MLLAAGYLRQLLSLHLSQNSLAAAAVAQLVKGH